MSGRLNALIHEFAETFPREPRDGVLYVSMEYATTMHLCPCGCGSEIIAPLGPADWQLTFDGVAISLRPSIGNWSLPCQSHYWIERGRVKWAARWTAEQIAAGRKRDRLAHGDYAKDADSEASEPPLTHDGWLGRIRRLITRHTR